MEQYVQHQSTKYKSIILILFLILQYLFHPDAKVKVDQGRLIIETEMVPLKYIKEKHQANIVFLLRNLSCFHSSKRQPQSQPQQKTYTNPKSQNGCIAELTYGDTYNTLKGAFSITWAILGIFEKIVGKVNSNNTV